MSVPALRVVEPPDADDAMVDDFLMFGQAAGWTTATLRTRRVPLGIFRRWVGVGLLDVTPMHCARFLAGYSGWTQATYFSSLRAFFGWAHKMGLRTDDPMLPVTRPRLPRSAPRPVTTQALEEAYAAAHRRARVYILLAAYAGLRVHEIAKVRGEDVDRDEGTFRVIGKGGVEAVIPAHPRLLTGTRGCPDAGFWFPAADGHVAAGSVSQTIGRAFARAGHPDVTAHQLRHWFGTNVLRSAGGNLRVAQELLRHASPATTAIYTLVEDRERREAVQRLPG